MADWLVYCPVTRPTAVVLTSVGRVGELVRSPEPGLPGFRCSRGGDPFRVSPPADVWLVISALLQLCLQLLQTRLVLARVVTAEQQFSS
jgi:hypothetical protein